ncbi:hypothetical protein CUR85_07910 [Sulfitobacter faviae]|nr:hypothetical protein [Sulfitobacter faviae]
MPLIETAQIAVRHPAEGDDPVSRGRLRRDTGYITTDNNQGRDLITACRMRVDQRAQVLVRTAVANA